MALLQSQLATLSREQLEAMVLAANKPRAHSMKVSEKGAVSVYGFGKWPVTLYGGQWEELFTIVDDIKQFIVVNRDLLSVKA